MTSETITFEGMEYHVVMYLSEMAGRNAVIKRCHDAIKETEASLALHGVTYTDMPGSPNSYADAIPDGIIRLMEAREKHLEAIAEHNRITQECWWLTMGSGSENRAALWQHYVEGRTWKDIAESVPCAIASMYRMRVDGIVELYYAMPEEWRRIQTRVL